LICERESRPQSCFGESRADVFVAESYERNKKRVPDFAIWGPDQLDEDGLPHANAGKAVNPHLIFQFSWGKFEKEKLAVGNMTMYAGLGNYEALGRPNVVYLIKAKRRENPSPLVDSPVHGFDV
jgi:hypothetical protein